MKQGHQETETDTGTALEPDPDPNTTKCSPPIAPHYIYNRTGPILDSPQDGLFASAILAATDCTRNMCLFFPSDRVGCAFSQRGNCRNILSQLFLTISLMLFLVRCLGEARSIVWLNQFRHLWFIYFSMSIIHHFNTTPDRSPPQSLSRHSGRHQDLVIFPVSYRATGPQPPHPLSATRHQNPRKVTGDIKFIWFW